MLPISHIAEPSGIGNEDGSMPQVLILLFEQFRIPAR